MKPSYTSPLNVLKFDILTQKRIFKKMLTGSFPPYSHRFSLIRYFTACSLFSFSLLTESLAQAMGNGET